MDYLGELEEFGLVEKKRRGRGLPSILYVKSFLVPETERRPSKIEEPDEDDDDVSNDEMDTSGDFRSSQIDTSYEL